MKTKFGAVRKFLLAFCLIISLGVHVGAVWLASKHPPLFSLPEQKAVLKASPCPQMLIVERMEKALEESLRGVITQARYTMPKGPMGGDAAEVKVVKNDFAIDSAKLKEEEEKKLFEIKKEDLLSIEVEALSMIAPLAPLFDPEQEASFADFALNETPSDEETLKEAVAFFKVEFSHFEPLHFAFLAPLEKLKSEDDYSLESQVSSGYEISKEHVKGFDNRLFQVIASLHQISPSYIAPEEPVLPEKQFIDFSESHDSKLVLPNAVEKLRTEWINRVLSEKKLPLLEHYELEKIASAVTWEEDFEVEVHLMPDAEGSKYIFSLAFRPQFGRECMPMEQNFYFVIDCTGSSEKLKSSRHLRAVQRALAALREGDTFNIFIYNKKVSVLSEKNLPVTAKTIQKAENFLEEQTSKLSFAALDLCNCLEKVVLNRASDEKMHSVILLSDGSSLLTPVKQKKESIPWFKKFEGMCNIYTVASGKENHLAELDALSHCTGGQLLYSDTNAALPRKLVRLIKELHQPLLKNITVEVLTEDKQAQVMVYPQSKYMPPLFAESPYTIVGTLDEPCDLTLLMQGQNQGCYFNLRKRISLKGAKMGTSALKKMWAEVQAKICYENFLRNGKSSYLQEAQKVVAPYQGVISIQQ